MIKLKIIKLFALLLFLGSVFFFLRTTDVNAGLAKTKFLGNIIASSVPSNFAIYWNQVTPENSTKWALVEASRDIMRWYTADVAFNYARSNGFPFKFYTLVWGSSGLGWLSGLSAADQKAEVAEWIQAAGQRYGSAEFVDVVNEPLHTKPLYRNAIGGDGSTGWDWVIWSFEQARSAFPNSKLLLNEYGIISDPNAAANYITIINLLKSRGLIDGIGIQCHQFNMDTVSTSTMRSVLDMLAATGLPIYVSELDMSGDDSAQFARYQEKFPVLWEHPAVAGVTLWGYIQGQTWISSTHLITSSGTERPAMQWLRQYFSANTTSNPNTPTPRQITPTPARTATPRPGTPTVTPIKTPTPRISGNSTPVPGGDYGVTYTMSDWGSGATVNITIKNNTETVVNGWTLAWTFPGNQKVTNMWNASYTQIGAAITAKNQTHNAIIGANGGTQSYGFNLSYTGTNAKPAGFTLNGTACQVQ